MVFLNESGEVYIAEHVSSTSWTQSSDTLLFCVEDSPNWDTRINRGLLDEIVADLDDDEIALLEGEDCPEAEELRRRIEEGCCESWVAASYEYDRDERSWSFSAHYDCGGAPVEAGREGSATLAKKLRAIDGVEVVEVKANLIRLWIRVEDD
jgi:hypothetical protein